MSGQIGVTGLATMGANLARNLARHGHQVVVHNRTQARTDALLEAHGDEGDFVAAASPQELVDALEQPPKAAPAVPEEEAMAEAAAADEAAQDREVASVLAPQDSVVDALGTKGTVPEVVAEEAEATGAEATVVETAEETGESTTESSDADAAEDTSVIDLKAAAEATEAELASDAANLDDGKRDCCDADWEIVAEETTEAEPEAAASPDKAAPRQEPAGQEMTRAADASAACVVDTGKVMEMVAALCEQNAQQCAVIAALAERVDALERTVRRMEDAERRAEKLSWEAGEATTSSSAAIKF